MYVYCDRVVDGANYLDFLEADSEFLRSVNFRAFQRIHQFAFDILNFDNRCTITIPNFTNNFKMLFKLFILYTSHILFISILF
jgi:hypothetical protein